MDLRAVQRAHGLAVEPLTIREARSREPLLSPGISCAFDIPADHQVDPRRLVESLAAARPAHTRVPDGRTGAGRVRGPANAAGLLWADGAGARRPASPAAGLSGAAETMVANGLGAAIARGPARRARLAAAAGLRRHPPAPGSGATRGRC